MTDCRQPKSWPLSVDNAGSPDAVIVRNNGIRRVRVRVKGNTCAFNAYEPLVDSGPDNCDIGDFYDFTKDNGWYTAGETVGYLETVGVASAIFSVQEMGL
jgi:hypothetical protein